MIVSTISPIDIVEINTTVLIVNIVKVANTASSVNNLSDDNSTMANVNYLSIYLSIYLYI